MKKHITILGTAYIAFNIMAILAAAIVFAVFFGSGLISQDSEAMWILNIIGSAIAGFLLITGLPGIIAAIGLMRYRPWGRIMTLILGFIELFNIPFGTALGIYTIWVLMNEETIALFNPKGKN